MSSSGQVIKAQQWFAKKGQGLVATGKVSATREMLIGLGFGLAAGVWWKTYHWNEARKMEQYYYDLDKLDKLSKENAADE